MFFTITKLKPINAEWVRHKVLNVPPYLSYDNQTACLNLDSFDVVSKIPVGSIRSFNVVDNVMWVSIGI